MPDYIKNARVFLAFCNETRLRVLELLRTGEKCAEMLLKQVSVGQSTLSHHMKVLVESGIVTARRAGKRTYYSIKESEGQHAIELIKQLTGQSPSDATDNNHAHSQY